MSVWIIRQGNQKEPHCNYISIRIQYYIQNIKNGQWSNEKLHINDRPDLDQQHIIIEPEDIFQTGTSSILNIIKMNDQQT